MRGDFFVYRQRKVTAMSVLVPGQAPAFAVPDANLAPIPPSRMFLINKSLKVYAERNPNSKTYDASQGDGGASLPLYGQRHEVGRLVHAWRESFGLAPLNARFPNSDNWCIM